MRAVFQWNLGTRTLELGKRTLIMGIVNVTPDSFSDGGLYLDAEKAIDHAHRLLDEGADIIDIGGESTRPGARTIAVTAEEELQRVLPVITALKKLRPDAVISIDTYKASVARAAAAAGAEIVNDVSGLRWDPQMARTIAEIKCGAVLMHMRGRPEEWRTLPPPGDIVLLVKRELRDWVEAAVLAGSAPGKDRARSRLRFRKKFRSELSAAGCAFRNCNRSVFRWWRERRENRSWAAPLRKTGKTPPLPTGSTEISPPRPP